MGRRYLLALVSALLIGGSAHAGQRCDTTPLTPEQARNALDLAHRTADALERSGAQVALLGRAGQDLSAYGLRYSHVGIAYREQPAFGPARWRVLHKLNQCGTAYAGVYRQGLADFSSTSRIATRRTSRSSTRRFRRRCFRACRQPHRCRECTGRPTAWWHTPGLTATSNPTSG